MRGQTWAPSSSQRWVAVLALTMAAAYPAADALARLELRDSANQAPPLLTLSGLSLAWAARSHGDGRARNFQDVHLLRPLARLSRRQQDVQLPAL